MKSQLVSSFDLYYLIVVNNSGLIYILSFAVGFFLGNVFPMMISLGGELFPEQSGSFSGFLATASTIGGTVTISITGIIAKAVGVEPVLWISLIALMLVVIMSRIFRVKYLNLGKKTFEV